MGYWRTAANWINNIQIEVWFDFIGLVKFALIQMPMALDDEWQGLLLMLLANGYFHPHTPPPSHRRRSYFRLSRWWWGITRIQPFGRASKHINFDRNRMWLRDWSGRSVCFCTLNAGIMQFYEVTRSPMCVLHACVNFTNLFNCGETVYLTSNMNVIGNWTLYCAQWRLS